MTHWKISKCLVHFEWSSFLAYFLFYAPKTFLNSWKIFWGPHSILGSLKNVRFICFTNNETLVVMPEAWEVSNSSEIISNYSYTWKSDLQVYQIGFTLRPHFQTIYTWAHLLLELMTWFMILNDRLGAAEHFALTWGNF